MESPLQLKSLGVACFVQNKQTIALELISLNVMK